MSWPTRKDSRDFSRALGEPDMETLTYWVQRLEPLVRAELDKEVIVIFCNRSGQEDDVLYAGTSAVIGIKDGEVSVYGLGGRGTKEFLSVDTSEPPFAKLVQNEHEDEELESEGAVGAEVRNSADQAKWNVDSSKWASPPSTGTSFSFSEPAGSIATASGSAQPLSAAAQARRGRPSPKLQIPQQPNFGHFARPGQRSESPTTIPTPTAPSPTPMAVRPKLIIPETNVITAGFNRKPSPFPHDKYFLEQHRFFGGRQPQTFAPITPLEEAPQSSTSLYWKPLDTLLKTPANLSWTIADTPGPPVGSKSTGSGPPFPGATFPNRVKSGPRDHTSSVRAGSSLKSSETLPPSEPGTPNKADNTTDSHGGARNALRGLFPQRPSTTGPHSQARTRDEDRSRNNPGRHDVNSVPWTTDRSSPPSRTASAADTRQTRHGKAADSFRPSRTDSPKFHHASRAQGGREEASQEQRMTNTPRPSHSTSPPLGQAGPGGVRPPSRKGYGAEDIRRPGSRPTHRQHSGSVVRHSRSRSASVVRNTDERMGHRTVRPQSPDRGHDERRSVSRGRQRWAGEQSLPRGDSKQASLPLAEAKDNIFIPRHISVTRIHSSSKPAAVRHATPDDEIVAVEEYIYPTQEQHLNRAPPMPASPAKMPSIEDGRAILGMACNLPPPPPAHHLDPNVRIHTPTVLGGSVKTTIITTAGHGDSGGSPPHSANSMASSAASQFSHATSGSATPDDERFPTGTPRPGIISRFGKERRVDTPVPPAYDPYGSPRLEY